MSRRGLPAHTRTGLTTFALFAAALAAPAHSAIAGSVVVGASRDNTLYESPTGSLSNGAGPTLFAGRTAQATNSRRRGLLAFDVAAAVPAGSTITSVRLTLSLSQTAVSGAQPVALHRLLTDWGEGASNAGASGGSGAVAQPGDATWLHTFLPGSFWTAAGGDFSAGASATLAVDEIGFYTWGSTPGMVADVQTWLDTPAANFGWLLRGNEATVQTAKRFDTRESEATLRPALSIEYEPPTPTRAATWGAIKNLYH